MQTNQTDILAACDRALELDAKATPQPWKWHWRKDDELSPASIYSQPHEGHALAVAMCPRYGAEIFPEDADFIANSRTFAPSAARWIKAAVEREAAKDAEIAGLKSQIEAQGKTLDALQDTQEPAMKNLRKRAADLAIARNHFKAIHAAEQEWRVKAEGERNALKVALEALVDCISETRGPNAYEALRQARAALAAIKEVQP